MDLWFDEIGSPVGTIVVVSDGTSLCSLDFGDFGERMHKLLGARYGEVRLMRADNPQGFSERVRAYLAGDMPSLDDIPVSTGGTPFQAQVWAALRTIPAGTTITYGELAARVGRPTAARAVGMTNSLNPIAIVLPCHRVIGANASLTGYAGGLERKRWLLEHEGAFPTPARAALQERLAV
ncbi:MAG TPA: methylated-DNA--[protein]-cysteine S-methyltransferase [Herpetosiphonaceae bacterium]|nr:methylated-DNA--[protein]-cysteine S-methyltransferase [Herpetosiphonaceae bacterium]